MDRLLRVIAPSVLDRALAFAPPCLDPEAPTFADRHRVAAFRAAYSGPVVGLFRAVARLTTPYAAGPGLTDALDRLSQRAARRYGLRESGHGYDLADLDTQLVRLHMRSRALCGLAQLVAEGEAIAASTARALERSAAVPAALTDEEFEVALDLARPRACARGGSDPAPPVTRLRGRIEDALRARGASPRWYRPVVDDLVRRGSEIVLAELADGGELEDVLEEVAAIAEVLPALLAARRGAPALVADMEEPDRATA